MHACVHICAHLSYAIAVLENVEQMSCAPKAALHHNNVCMCGDVSVCATLKTKQAINNYVLEEENNKQQHKQRRRGKKIAKSVCAHYIIISLAVKREGHTRREPETRLHIVVIITKIEVKKRKKSAKSESFVRVLWQKRKRRRRNNVSNKQ